MGEAAAMLALPTSAKFAKPHGSTSLRGSNGDVILSV
jgi:hypothetical protein